MIDETIYAYLIKLCVKLALVALAVHLLLGSLVDWSTWKTYAAIAILVGIS